MHSTSRILMMFALGAGLAQFDVHAKDDTPFAWNSEFYESRLGWQPYALADDETLRRLKVPPLIDPEFAENAAKKFKEPAMVAIPGTHFSLGKYEVTQELWSAVMGYNPSFSQACGGQCPVEMVSWNEVQQFIEKMNKRTGKQYRLPTEDEWLYACEGGQHHKYCGSNDLNKIAWHKYNAKNKPHPVGLKKPNAYELYDMTGNVWEWLQDCYSKECDSRILIGGSWWNGPLFSRIGRYVSNPPQDRFPVGGFRLALSI